MSVMEEPSGMNAFSLGRILTQLVSGRFGTSGGWHNMHLNVEATQQMMEEHRATREDAR
jgi:hypothetical protein